MGNNAWKLLCGSVVMLAMMAGCSGKEAQALPESYELGQETLPALGEEQGVTIDNGAACTVTTDEETGVTTYAYTGLTSGQETAKAYLETLEANGCSAIDEVGMRQETATVDGEEGQLLMGRDAADGAGILEIQLQWSAQECQLTASILEGMQIQDPNSTELEPIGLTQAVDRLESMSPELLGQTPDQPYTVYADDGYIMVDEDVCYRLNLYRHTTVDTTAIVGTYCMSLDGERIYRLDQQTGQATLLSTDQTTLQAG